MSRSIDERGVDPARYEADLADCRSYSEQVDTVGQAAKHGAAGAVVGRDRWCCARWCVRRGRRGRRCLNRRGARRRRSAGTQGAGVPQLHGWPGATKCSAELAARFAGCASASVRATLAARPQLDPIGLAPSGRWFHFRYPFPTLAATMFSASCREMTSAYLASKSNRLASWGVRVAVPPPLHGAPPQGSRAAGRPPRWHGRSRWWSGR